MSMSMESMEWGRELECGAVGVVVDVGVGDVTEVVPFFGPASHDDDDNIRHSSISRVQENVKSRLV